ncbi:hypothetical protein [Streptomyces sp. UH6]|uniref:hypothetical protein n=1 Tax=Streptomyces sp. UH6 TaxID=2748379 RepID=UPI00211DED5D|nr:hypothetical protein [Streptomyces sp. UH6]
MQFRLAASAFVGESTFAHQAFDAQPDLTDFSTIKDSFWRNSTEAVTPLHDVPARPAIAHGHRARRTPTAST